MLLPAAAVLLVPLVRAQEAARPLTVELFSAHAVDAITFTPAGAQSWMRACAACARTEVRAPIHLTLNAGKLRTAAGTSARPLKLEGTFRVQSDPYPGQIQSSGLWEVKASTRLKSDRNRLQILLTMPSERYVAAALNGEAATDEPIESLKAMAVVMRTYALTNASRHAAEGFNLCDSTHCQALGWGRSGRGSKRRYSTLREKRCGSGGSGPRSSIPSIAEERRRMLRVCGAELACRISARMATHIVCAGPRRAGMLRFH